MAREDEQLTAGLALRLAASPTRLLESRLSSVSSRVVSLGDWRIEITEGAQYVVAQDRSGVRRQGYRSVFEAGLVRAQQALDYLSASGFADLQTVETADMHIVWWPEATGLVLRVCDTAVLRPSMSARATVLDANGNEVPGAPAPPPLWDESMRFYRQSQLAEDVFDAARSLWLATENLLDEIAEWREPGHEKEGESDWVKRAFRAASGRGVDLVQYLPATNKAAHNAAHDYFYDELRKDLFHAKRSRKPGLPLDTTAMARIAERYNRLTKLYGALLREVVGVSRGGGGITRAGFDLMTGWMDQGLALRVGGGVDGPTAPMVPVPELSRAGRRVLIAEVPGDAVGNLEDIRNLSVAHGENDVADIDLGADLRLTELACLQAQFAVRYENVQEPRSFATP